MPGHDTLTLPIFVEAEKRVSFQLRKLGSACAPTYN